MKFAIQGLEVNFTLSSMGHFINRPDTSGTWIASLISILRNVNLGELTLSGDCKPTVELTGAAKEWTSRSVDLGSIWTCDGAYRARVRLPYFSYQELVPTSDSPSNITPLFVSIPRQSTRLRKQPTWLKDFVSNIIHPTTDSYVVSHHLL
ncbi:Uncharacterized protein Fot_42720 [Forsythia ovata]|uniref:Uncharacterized protein n=1 Tax=Forsythia ovata TaxID=205694 RepID=A0ABD1RNR3_9LAMI